MTRSELCLGVALVSATCTLFGAVSAPAGRGMTIEDLLTAVRVSDPQLSPDGRTVVFVRTTTDLSSGRRNADIWSVPADGSAGPEEIIANDRNDTTPRFSPDGRRLAFISARDGTPQVYIADADGDDGKQITDLAMGVQPPVVFSPDGTKLAFVSDVYPECSDEDCNRKKKEQIERDPVKMRRITRLLYRHWDEWREQVRHHVFVADIDSGRATDVTPGDFDSPPVRQEDAAIAFSTDGREIAFVSNREGPDREAWTTNHDVWIVPAAGGTARRLTTSPAADVQPVFSPDGRTLYVRSQRRAGFESDRWYLDAWDLKTGVRRTLFTTPDLSVGDFAVSRDGTSIWFTASQDGRENLFVVPAAGGVPQRVLQGGAISAARPAEGFVVFSRSTLTAPAEIFRARVDGTGVLPLTRENAGWLKEVNFSEPRSLSVSGAGGARVQYWLITPPGFSPDRKYPVVFLIHGGPQGAWEDAWSYRWNPSLWAAQGWIVVAPNPRGSTGFGQTFVDEISRDWAGRVMTDLDAVFDAVSKEPFADASRMGIAGASYGGYAVNWIIGHTQRFRAAVTHDGVFNLESMSLSTEELWFPEWEFGGPPWEPAARAQYAKWSPHLFAHNIKTPTLIITNELDFRVPVDQGLQMFTALRRNGVPAEMLVFPDEGHWVLKPLNSRAWHEAVFGWLQKHVSSSGTASQ
ncbi:MAG TPA: S9 family peptidase [Vicinamibacterales bacterium]|nr:S9 family peptidase [Vicinamibacterales bacterium]